MLARGGVVAAMSLVERQVNGVGKVYPAWRDRTEGDKGWLKHHLKSRVDVIYK